MKTQLQELIENIEVEENIFTNKDIAHIFINENKILSSNIIPPLKIKVKELKDGIKVNIIVKRNKIISHPVHLCFGMLKKVGTQKIFLNLKIEDNTQIFILAHCVFPNVTNFTHIMEGEIEVGKNSKYYYVENHIHSNQGSIQVIPKAKVILNEGSTYNNDFVLTKGKVGTFNMDYEVISAPYSKANMDIKLSGKANDIIKVHETIILRGKYAKGVLTSKIALIDNANAEVYNKIVAEEEGCRGHVDCKEIVQGNSSASAIPIVEVKHPQARVTHEAAIGSVDSKQLETLMARGMTEKEATELIVKSLLK